MRHPIGIALAGLRGPKLVKQRWFASVTVQGEVIDDMAAAISPPDGAEATFVAEHGQTAQGLPALI